MRPAAATLLAVALIACSSQAAAQPSPSGAPSAQSPAADLRVHLDLLLGEHVMIVAKESEAAVYHSYEYTPYTTLLGANNADLSALVGRAVGATTATRFTQLWNMQNGYLVDYAIGVVTHDDDKANAAMTGLRGNFQPHFGTLFAGIGVGDQVNADKAFIDDLVAQNYSSFYSDLHVAYGHSQGIGDTLAEQFVTRFPDKFPGRTGDVDVNKRVTMNLALQEHSYLATMATDSAVAGRDSEKSAAMSALATNTKRLDKAWSDWDAAVVAYATGAAFEAAQFAGGLANGAPRAAVDHLIAATIKAVDDQKGKNSKALADDDRAAATATQPIADSVKG